MSAQKQFKETRHALACGRHAHGLNKTHHLPINWKGLLICKVLLISDPSKLLQVYVNLTNNANQTKHHIQYSTSWSMQSESLFGLSCDNFDLSWLWCDNPDPDWPLCDNPDPNWVWRDDLGSCRNRPYYDVKHHHINDEMVLLAKAADETREVKKNHPNRKFLHSGCLSFTC